MNRIMGRRQFFGSIARVVRQVAGVMLGGWMAVGSANTNWPPPDGWVVTQGGQGGIFIIDAAKGSILRALPTAFSERGEGGTLAPASETIASVNRQLLAISRPNSGIRVWDVSLNRIVWSHAEARAVGFLGADGRRLAVLVRAPGASMTEFAVWDLHDERKIFSRIIPARIQAVPQALNSDRFAVFTIDQREIWVWDDVSSQLRAVPLPYNVEVDDREIRWPSREALRSMVLAPDGRTLVFGGYKLRLRSMDLVAWTQPRRYDYPDGAWGQFYLLGVSADGHYLVTWNQTDFMQFDLVSGVLAHKWSVYSDEIIVFRRPKGGLSGGRLDNKHVRAPLRSFPEISRDGRLMAIWDYAQKVPVVFDISSSPPQEVSPRRGSLPVCDASAQKCGNGIDGGRGGQIRFVEPGGDLMVFARGGHIEADTLWHFDRLGKRGQMLRWPTIDERKAALRLSPSEDGPRKCAADPEVCTRLGEASLRTGHVDVASSHFESACLQGARLDACLRLRDIAAAANDRPMEALAMAASCAFFVAYGEKKVPDACADWSVATPSASLIKPLQERCRRKKESCWAVALALSRGGSFDRDILALTTPSCRAGHRPACMVGGEQAFRLGAGEQAISLYNRACGLRPGDDCRNGLKQAMAKENWPLWARPGTERPLQEAPQLCKRLIEDRLLIVGSRHEVEGRFVGIRLSEPAIPMADESSLFAPGDILFNGGWCPESGCDDREFQEALWQTCSASRLVRDVRLEVGSAVQARNRRLLLTKRNQ